MSTSDENQVDEEKEEMLRKIKYWEDKYGEIESKYTTLSQKFEAEESRKLDTDVDSRIEMAEMKKLITTAIQGLNSLANEVRSSAEYRNKERLDEDRQYHQKNSLLLHKMNNIPLNIYGLDFIKHIRDAINTLFPNLEEPLKLCHIDDAHVLKTKKSGNSKVIIVKFSCRWMKNLIYKHRSELKGTANEHISITEHLTANTIELLESVKNLVGKGTKVYTNNCIINLKYNNRKYYIKNFKDLQYLAEKIGRRVPPPGGFIPQTELLPNQGYAVGSHPNSAPSHNIAPVHEMVSPESRNYYDPTRPVQYQNYYMPPQGRASAIGRGHMVHNY